MLGCLITALGLGLASWAVGRSVLERVWPRPDSPLAPLVGFGILLAVASAAIRLPGHATTAAVVLCLVSIVCVGALRRLPAPDAAAVALVVLAAVLMPFIVNGRFGLLGQSVGDDLGSHYAIAEALGHGLGLPLPSRSAGYPVGPHSLAAAAASISGDINGAFTSVMMLIPLLTAWCGLAALRVVALPLRVLGAALIGFPYLSAAFYAQNSFKEMLAAAFVLGLVVGIRELWLERSVLSRRAGWALAPLAAGGVLTIGTPALAWPVAALILAALPAIWTAGRGGARDLLKRWSGPMVAAVTATLLLVLPRIDQVLAFAPSDAAAAGNSDFKGGYFGDISFYQVLGVWPAGDFRYVPGDISLFHVGLIAGLGVALAAFATGWWLSRGDLMVPAAAVSAVVIYAATREREGPYVTAKVLMISAPVVALLMLGPLLTEVSRRGGAIRRLGALVATAALAAGSGYSSYLVVTSARVGSLGHSDELASYRNIVRGQDTLLLPEDHYANWELIGSRLSTPTVWSILSDIPITPRKPGIGAPVDFDSVDARTLDQMTYVVAARTVTASEVPPNFRRVRTGRWYAVWKRGGPTPQREILEEGTEPGAVLDCSGEPGRLLSRKSGVARVRVPPLEIPAEGWANNGVPGTASGPFLVSMNGSSVTGTLDLPPGTWELSLQYQSEIPITLSAAGRRWSLPPLLTTFGSRWRVGTMTSTGGPLEVKMHLEDPPLEIVGRLALIGQLAATPLPTRFRTVPLRAACGKYVDWYRLSG